MRAAIEISMYPLAGDYRPLIQAFIDRLNTYEELRVETNSLSTQVWGSLERMLAILAVEMGRSAVEGPQPVFVMKVLPGARAAPGCAVNPLEMVAAVLAVAYLTLAIKQLKSCWIAAFSSSCLYVVVLFGARLYMESALNAFYAAMALYGYRQWTRGGRGGGLRVTRWSWQRHATALLAIIAMSCVSSLLLRRFTPAAWPFVDSMVTWSSVFATWLVARKVYENWHWWLVIDSVSLCLYFNRRLYLTMLLFGVYLVMIVVGMREWRRDLRPAVCGAQLA